MSFLCGFIGQRSDWYSGLGLIGRYRDGGLSPPDDTDHFFTERPGNKQKIGRKQPETPHQNALIKRGHGQNREVVGIVGGLQ
jgi:hypothetical protein